MKNSKECNIEEYDYKLNVNSKKKHEQQWSILGREKEAFNDKYWQDRYRIHW